MSITDNANTEGLRKALQDARSKLTRQTDTVKATIALIKLLEVAIVEGDTPRPPLTTTKGVSQHK